jgi:hypothetical protein
MTLPLTKREGLLLFWCEGDKPKDSLRKVQATNSNHLILKYFVEWLQNHYQIPRRTMKLRLHLWQGSDEMRAMEFWSNHLEIPLSNFTKTWFKPKGVKNTNPNGICRVSVSSKALMERIRSDMFNEFQSWQDELRNKSTFRVQFHPSLLLKSPVDGQPFEFS